MESKILLKQFINKNVVIWSVHDYPFGKCKLVASDAHGILVESDNHGDKVIQFIPYTTIKRIVLKED